MFLEKTTNYFALRTHFDPPSASFVLTLQFNLPGNVQIAGTR